MNILASIAAIALLIALFVSPDGQQLVSATFEFLSTLFEGFGAFVEAVSQDRGQQ